MMINGGWLGLEDKVAAELSKSRSERDEISFTHAVRMQYYGQLVDIEVDSPKSELTTAADAQGLCDAFEQTYTRMYARAASSPELGYLVAQAIVKGLLPGEQPRLLVLNKADLLDPDAQARLRNATRGAGVLVSAARGLGLDQLRERIEQSQP